MANISNVMTGGGQNNYDVHQWLHWQQLDRANLRAQEDELAKSTVAAIGKVVNDYFEARTSAQTDSDLSVSGLQRKLEGLSKQAMTALDALAGPILKALDERAVAAEVALRRAANGPADDLARTMLKIEVRATALDVDSLILQTTYLRLCEDGGDDLSCLAVEEAPIFWAKRLAPDIIERGRLLRAARLVPDQHEELRQVGEMRTTLGAAVAQARRELSLSFATLDDLEKAAMGTSFTPDAA